MKAEFLKNQLSNIYLANFRAGISGILQKISNIRGSTSNDRMKSTRVREQLLILKSKSEGLNFENIAFAYPFASTGEFQRYLTSNIYSIVVGYFRDFSTEDTFFDAVSALKLKYDAVLTRASDAYFGLDQVGVRDLPQEVFDNFFIEIKFPYSRYTNDLEDVGREISEQARILKLLSDGLGYSRLEFPVFAFSSSKLSVFVKTNYQYATHFSAVVCFLLSTASSIIDIRMKASELNDILGKSDETTVSDAVVSAVAQKCAEKISAEFNAESADAIFSAEKCAVAAKRIFESIERGFQYDIHAPRSNKSPSTNESDEKSEADDKRDRIQSISKELKHQFNALPDGQPVKQIEMHEAIE